MKIAFIADSEQELDVFPDLIEALSSEMKDLQAKELFVDSMLDIPAKCVECRDFDLIFAMHLHAEGDDAKDSRIGILLEKLVDFELSHKVKVVKAICPSGLEDALTEEDFDAAKEEFVEKWKAVILGVLFDDSVFRPKPAGDGEDDDEDSEDGLENDSED